MPAKQVKIYPVRGRFIVGVPAAVHLAESKGRAAELIETGAFTDNPNDPERDTDAVDLTSTPEAVASDEQPTTSVPQEGATVIVPEPASGESSEEG